MAVAVAAVGVGSRVVAVRGFAPRISDWASFALLVKLTMPTRCIVNCILHNLRSLPCLPVIQICAVGFNPVGNDWGKCIKLHGSV